MTKELFTHWKIKPFMQPFIQEGTKTKIPNHLYSSEMKTYYEKTYKTQGSLIRGICIVLNAFITWEQRLKIKKMRKKLVILISKNYEACI